MNGSFKSCPMQIGTAIEVGRLIDRWRKASARQMIRAPHGEQNPAYKLAILNLLHGRFIFFNCGNLKVDKIEVGLRITFGSKSLTFKRLILSSPH